MVIFIHSNNLEVNTFHFSTKKWKKSQIKVNLQENHTCLRYKDKVYIYGGETKGFVSDEFYEYNPKTEQFKNLTNGLVALSNHAACIDSNKMYIFGGTENKGNISKKIYFFDFEENKWNEFETKGEIIPALTEAHIQVVGKELFIFGGVTNLGILQSDYFFVNLHSKLSKKYSGETKRSRGNLIKLDEDHLLLVGGKGSNDINLFSVEAKRWDLCIYESTPLLGENSLVLFNNTLYCINKGLYSCKISKSGIFGLFLNEDLSDVKILLGNEKLPGHKSILSQAKNFEKILNSNNELDLRSYDYNLMIRALKYIYGSPLTCSGHELTSLIYLSREIDLPELEIHCVNQLEELDPYQILDVLSKSEEYIRKTKKQRFYVGDYLKQLCFEWYQKNLDKFDTKELYEKIQSLDKDLLIEMIVLPTLEKEESLLPRDGIRDEQISKHFSSLLSNQRFTDSIIISKSENHNIHKALFYGIKYLMNDKTFFEDDPELVKLFIKTIYDPSIDINEKNQQALSIFSLKYDLGYDSAPFKPIKFTTLDAVGRDGPKSTHGYKGSPLDGKVSLKNGIQIWRVPKTRNYKITCAGASGGTGDRLKPKPGRGAICSGVFRLSIGTVLHIVVGQKGGNGPSNSNSAGGGGGGTYVVQDGKIPLIIAGGGNGDSWRSWNTDGVDAINIGKKESIQPHETKGGASGRGGGGGGFAQNGTDKNSETGGKSFSNGCKGGTNIVSGCIGGFGGGGGAEYEGGGGGGYNGGSVVDCNTYNQSFPDRGATSYCSGVKPQAIGFNTGDGYVLIE